LPSNAVTPEASFDPTALGIPAIKFGPRGKRTGRTEQLPIDSMVTAAQVYALLALQICNQSPPLTTPHQGVADGHGLRGCHPHGHVVADVPHLTLKLLAIWPRQALRYLLA
jgi:hypothetical protein